MPSTEPTREELAILQENLMLLPNPPGHVIVPIQAPAPVHAAVNPEPDNGWKCTSTDFYLLFLSSTVGLGVELSAFLFGGPVVGGVVTGVLSLCGFAYAGKRCCYDRYHHDQSPPPGVLMA